MNELRDAVKEYIAFRQSLGFKLDGLSSFLRGFTTFLEAEGASHITVERAIRWAKYPSGSQPVTWARRLRWIRGFARWRQATDPRTEIPPAELVTHRYRRATPYIYSDQEIRRLLQAAREISSPTGLKGHTYQTLFGILAVTGMRSSEVVALNREDVDLDEGILTIRRTKFGKSRLAPVHESTREALTRYAVVRDRIFPHPTTASFFLSEEGARVSVWAARYNFAKVSREVGLRAPAKPYGHGHGPRLHDMRHRFAACTLVDWYRAGKNVEQEIPKLATYLGHVHVNETYWYIEGIPELLELATQRLEQGAKEANQ